MPPGQQPDFLNGDWAGGGLQTFKSGFTDNLRSDATFSMIAKDSSFYSHERFGTSLPRAPQPVAFASACAHGVSCPVGLEVPAEVTPARS